MKDECNWFSSIDGLFSAAEKYIEKHSPEKDFIPELPAFPNPCNSKGEFQSLVLADLELGSYLNLTLSIPPEIALLTSLETLALPFNSITATLTDMLTMEPASLTKLASLYLYSNDTRDGKT